MEDTMKLKSTQIIYSEKLILKTLKVLENVNELYESHVQVLIDQVYSEFDDNFENIFNETYNDFLKMVSYLRGYGWICSRWEIYKFILCYFVACSNFSWNSFF